MAVKFSIAEGGFVQDPNAGGARIDFRIKGAIENPNLESITAPAYTSSGLDINSATLVINDGKVGSFKVEVRSIDIGGANSVTHLSQTITLGSAGAAGQALTVDVASIAAGKVIKLYVQYVSGAVSSDISITLE
jgi:hypothetical protein